MGKPAYHRKLVVRHLDGEQGVLCLPYYKAKDDRRLTLHGER
jgi:hypothetical protein